MLKSLWNLLRNKRKEVDVIYGERLILKPLMPKDAKAVTKLVTDNRDYWSIYEPHHIESYYTIYTQYNKLVESARLRSLNLEYFFGIYDKESGQLVGQISLYSIKQLPFLSCFIGYAMDQHYVGKGIVSEAISLMVQFAFKQIKLNRVEAYVSPRNVASVRVLEKNGFTKEGLLKQLLYINGRWEDHYLYAITFEQYKKLLSQK